LILLLFHEKPLSSPKERGRFDVMVKRRTAESVARIFYKLPLFALGKTSFYS